MSNSLKKAELSMKKTLELTIVAFEKNVINDPQNKYHWLDQIEQHKETIRSINNKYPDSLENTIQP